MKITIILTLLLLISCKQVINTDKVDGSLKLNCVDLNYLIRCENSEVICYREANGIQCKFKTGK